MRRTHRGFVVCGGCHRHVQLILFDGTESCTFCGTRVEANAAGEAPSAARAGGPRSALVFAALLGASAVGCGTSEARYVTPDAGAVRTAGDTSVDAPDGTRHDAGTHAAPDAGAVDAGRRDVRGRFVDTYNPAQPLYGAPPD